MDQFLSLFSQSETYLTLGTLIFMEIVLGVDNILFISIIAGRLPRDQQARARNIGLSLAVGMRILLLMLVGWITTMVEPLISIGSYGITGRDLIMLGGGLFLIYKTTVEIHNKIEGLTHGTDAAPERKSSFSSVIAQIMILDFVFSFDSVITAVGMAQHVSLMVIAVLVSLVFMVVFAGQISKFLEMHPTFKMLALGFLLMIGTVLVADGLHFHVPKGYLYFSIIFSMGIETLNMKVRKGSEKSRARKASKA